MEEKNAISQIKQGNWNGLEALVNRYQVRAVHAAYMIVFDHGLAEDITQAAFVKAAERISQFDENRPFGPWFFRIVVNDALKLARKQKSFISLEAHLDHPTSELAKWFANPGLGPEQMVEQKETRQIILKAIQSLPPEQRAVIVMQYFLDMSEKEMSAKMERPLSTIKWWLRDARKRLRSLMEPPQER